MDNESIDVDNRIQNKDKSNNNLPKFDVLLKKEIFKMSIINGSIINNNIYSNHNNQISMINTSNNKYI